MMDGYPLSKAVQQHISVSIEMGMTFFEDALFGLVQRD